MGESIEERSILSEVGTTLKQYLGGAFSGFLTGLVIEGKRLQEIDGNYMAAYASGALAGANMRNEDTTPVYASFIALAISLAPYVLDLIATGDGDRFSMELNNIVGKYITGLAAGAFFNYDLGEIPKRIFRKITGRPIDDEDDQDDEKLENEVFVENDPYDYYP